MRCKVEEKRLNIAGIYITVRQTGKTHMHACGYVGMKRDCEAVSMLIRQLRNWRAGATLP